MFPEILRHIQHHTTLFYQPPPCRAWHQTLGLTILSRATLNLVPLKSIKHESQTMCVNKFINIYIIAFSITYHNLLWYIMAWKPSWIFHHGSKTAAMVVKKPEALEWDKPPKPSTAPRALSNMIQHVHLIISDHFPQKKVQKKRWNHWNEWNQPSQQAISNT